MKYAIFLILFCAKGAYAAELSHFRVPISSAAQDIRSLMFKMACVKSREMRNHGDADDHKRSYDRIKAELEKLKGIK